ncbi:MAG TPA: M56 family metallopeptidase [Phycisphaerae bacterium]|nr:M56 family metallopeptidase [Phycisphaerae bacterium]
MGSTLEQWLPAMADWAARGCVVLAVAGLAAAAMRRSSAAARHGVWMLGFAGMLLLPAAAGVMPGWHVLPRAGGRAEARVVETYIVTPPADEDPYAGPSTRMLQQNQQPGAAAGAIGPAAQAHDGSEPGVLPVPAAAAGATPPTVVTLEAATALPPWTAAMPKSADVPHAALASPPLPQSMPWAAWAAIAWLAGAGVILGNVVAGHLSLKRLARRCRRVDDATWNRLLCDAQKQLGIRRRVELLGSPLRVMPMTWGLLRTRVLMPTDAEKWPVEQRRSVLLHELGHVRRRDCATQLVAQLACALFWFNPLVWIGWRQIQVERERACDDLVLTCGAKASAYATHLLQSAADVPGLRFVNSAALAMARTSTLEARLREILDPQRNRGGMTTRGAVTAVVAFAAVVIPLAALRARDLPAPAPSRADATPLPDSDAAAEAPLSAAQTAAVKEMIETAEKRTQDFARIESVSPRTPELLEAKLAWQRDALRARLLLQPTETDKAKLLDAFAREAAATSAAVEARANLDATHAAVAAAQHDKDQAAWLQALSAFARQAADTATAIEQRAGIDATPASIAAARRAKDQAALQARAALEWSPWSFSVPQGAADAQKALAQALVRDAEAVLEGIAEIEDVRPRTPEFLNLKVAWQRRLMEDKLFARTGAAERRAAAEEYLRQAKETEKAVQGRMNLDATKAALGEAEYAAADAEFILAVLEDGESRELSPKQRAAAEKMLAAANETVQGLDGIMDLRLKTPEFVQLALDAYRRVAAVKLLLKDPGRPLEEYSQQVAKLNSVLTSKPELTAPPSISTVRFAMAEAKYMLATREADGSRPAPDPQTSLPAGPAAAPPGDGDARVMVAAVIYDVRMDPEKIGKMDASELTRAAGNAVDFEKALAALGTARPLYRKEQPAKLAGDSVEAFYDVPYATASRIDARGQTTNMVAQMQTGFYLDFAGRPRGVNGIDLDMRIGISAVTEGTVVIAGGVNAPIVRRPILMYAGSVELGKAFVAASASGEPVDTDGKAVAYIARIVMSRAGKDATPPG